MFPTTEEAVEDEKQRASFYKIPCDWDKQARVKAVGLAGV